jgi:hypothetical protein
MDTSNRDRTLFDPPFEGQRHASAEHRRRTSQCDRILDRLRQGPATNHELSQVALKYTNRISDLRDRGHVIECEDLGGGLTRYTLTREPAATADPHHGAFSR